MDPKQLSLASAAFQMPKLPPRSQERPAMLKAQASLLSSAHAEMRPLNGTAIARAQITTSHKT